MKNASTIQRTVLLGLCLLLVPIGIANNNLLLLGVGVLLSILLFNSTRDGFSVPSVQQNALVLYGLAGFFLLLTIALKLWNIENTVIPWVWIASIVLFMAAVWQADGRPSLEETLAKKRKPSALIRILQLTPVIWVGWALRLTNLETVPTLHGDEGEMGVFALNVLSGNAPPMTAVGWLHHPALFHYLQAPFVGIFGRTGFAIRYPSVIIGILCIPFIYYIGKRSFGPIAGWMAAWLLAVSHLHIHWSRIGLNNIYSVLAILVCFYCILRAKPNKIMAYAYTGIAIGLAQYLYFGSRLIPVIFGVVVLLLLFRKLASLEQILAMIVGAIIALAPLATFYILEPNTFSSRTDRVAIFSDVNVQQALNDPTASLPADLFPLISVQLQRNLGYFIQHGDRSAFYAHEIPGIDLLTAALFWLGLGLALAKIKRLPEQVLLLWFALGIALGGMLTNDAPNSPRLLIVFPVAYLLGGYVVQHVGSFFNGYSRPVRLGSLIGLAFMIGVLNTTVYYKELPTQPLRSWQGDAMAREVKTAAADAQVFVLGAPNIYAGYGTFLFLRGPDPQDLNTPDQLSLIEEGDFMAIAVPAQFQLLADLQAEYPDGTLETKLDHVGNPMYKVYRATR